LREGSTSAPIEAKFAFRDHSPVLPMNPPQAQSESDNAAAYFDPEALDLSEQVFSASLESPAERPQFVVDEEENPESVPEQTPAIGSSEHVSFGATEAPASDASGTPEQPALSRSDRSTPELNPDWR